MSWKRKNEQEGKEFWRLSLKVLNLPSSLLWWSWVELYKFRLRQMFFFPNLIFCIKIWSRGLAATLWLRGTTHTERRDVHDSGSGCFCKPRLVKSSKANSTPPIWLHFPLPYEPSPAGQVQAAHDTSHWGVNSTTTRKGDFFIDGKTLAFTYVLSSGGFAFKPFNVPFKEKNGKILIS